MEDPLPSLTRRIWHGALTPTRHRFFSLDIKVCRQVVAPLPPLGREVCRYLSADPPPLSDLLCSPGLWEHRNRFPSHVSGGQQQRYANGEPWSRTQPAATRQPHGHLDYSTPR